MLSEQVTGHMDNIIHHPVTLIDQKGKT